MRGLRSKAKPWKKALASRMSRNPTFPERLMWSRLKDKQLGVRFYKQSIILGYIADFYCPAAKLVVEVDGPMHEKQKKYDAIRDAVMLKAGIMTMRFTAQAVNNNLGAVVALVADKVRRRVG